LLSSGLSPSGLERGCIVPKEAAVESSDAIARLYSIYGKKVYMLAYGMSGDSALAQDVLQDTFVQIIKGFPGFRGDSTEGTWIYAIAKNECLRHLARIRRGSIDSLQGLIDTAASPEPPGMNELERRWYTAQVKEGCLLGLLRCLSFSRRMAFILSILFALPARDVSIILGKSENSVRILACRARQKIRDFLCANCSLYDPGNACRCEGFISFSLKNAWIKEYRPEYCAEAIESELKAIKSEVMLYTSFLDRDESPAGLGDILSKLSGREYSVLRKQKVK
jgi:RNA polymerase sigma factor (sigma-70 family)